MHFVVWMHINSSLGPHLSDGLIRIQTSFPQVVKFKCRLCASVKCSDNNDCVELVCMTFSVQLQRVCVLLLMWFMRSTLNTGHGSGGTGRLGEQLRDDGSLAQDPPYGDQGVPAE